MRLIACDCNAATQCPQGKTGASPRCTVWKRTDVNSTEMEALLLEARHTLALVGPRVAFEYRAIVQTTIDRIDAFREPTR